MAQLKILLKNNFVDNLKTYFQWVATFFYIYIFNKAADFKILV